MTIRTSKSSCSSPAVAKVAMMSSASYPSTSRVAMLSAANTFFVRST